MRDGARESDGAGVEVTTTTGDEEGAVEVAGTGRFAAG